MPCKSISMIRCCVFISLFLTSCGGVQDETTLTTSDKKYLEEIGITEPGEEIQLFYTQGGLDGIKQSGSLITSERVAAYWIEENEQEIHSALFASEIDSITLTDLINNPLYSSYLKVHKKDGTAFNVYVDADSTKTYRFFQQALDNLEAAR